MSQAPHATADSGDSETNEGELDRLLAGARDALTDDIVTRMSATASDGMDLLDRINRSGIADALPTLARMVRDGDLERVAGLARWAGSAQDALTDDIVARLAQTAGGGLDLLDRVNRSGIDRALPAIAELSENGDLERIVGLARLVGSAQDALSDDIIGRLALMAGELMCLVDRLARNPSFFRLLDLLGKPEVQNTLISLLEGLGSARRTVEQSPPPKGGLGGAAKLARDPGLHDALLFASAFGKQLRTQQE